MKVNTDSVLLGAWAEIPKEAKTGIDIGSGTGILGLMVAQRNTNIKLIGIEIEKNAFEESTNSFYNSPYNERLTAVNLPLQKFIPETKLDCIISNPPYFIDDLKNEDSNKTQARHTDTLSFQELILFAEKYLSDFGKFNLILPKTESEVFIKQTEKSNLFLQKIAHIQPNTNKKVNRVLLCFGLQKIELEKETFCVYKSQGVYSEKHKKLTVDFYLDK